MTNTNLKLIVRIPKTADVLRAIGKDGVIVGSVARGKLHPKDVDFVIPERGEQNKNAILTRLFALYPHAESLAIGHMRIRAVPRTVELFEGLTVMVPVEYDKKFQMTTFSAAMKTAIRRRVYGITCFVEKQSNG